MTRDEIEAHVRGCVQGIDPVTLEGRRVVVEKTAGGRHRPGDLCEKYYMFVFEPEATTVRAVRGHTDFHYPAQT